MRSVLIRRALAILEFGTCLAFPGTVQGDTKQDLKTEYVGKRCVLRNFYTGDHLKYDSGGNLTSGGEPGMWALDGIVRIEKFELRSDRLEVAARRLIVGWDGKQLYELDGDPVIIEIELGSGEPLPDGLRALLARVFYPLSTDASQLMPAYWRQFLQPHQVVRGMLEIGTTSDGEPIYAFTGEGPAMPAGWQNPKPAHVQDSPYSHQARTHRTQGVVAAAMLVDRRGRIADVMLTGKVLGDGLDQLAAATLRKWTFKPARQNGVTQDVVVHVEVRFRLF
jgi:TonB family protein